MHGMFQRTHVSPFSQLAQNICKHRSYIGSGLLLISALAYVSYTWLKSVQLTTASAISQEAVINNQAAPCIPPRTSIRSPYKFRYSIPSKNLYCRATPYLITIKSISKNNRQLTASEITTLASDKTNKKIISNFIQMLAKKHFSNRHLDPKNVIVIRYDVGGLLTKIRHIRNKEDLLPCMYQALSLLLSYPKQYESRFISVL